MSKPEKTFSDLRESLITRKRRRKNYSELLRRRAKRSQPMKAKMENSFRKLICWKSQTMILFSRYKHVDSFN